MIPIVLALLISWGSYADAQHRVPSDSFDTFPAIIYMYGTGFTPNSQYSVRFVDGSGLIAGDDIVTSKGNKLEAAYKTKYGDVAGTWYARVYDSTGQFVIEDQFEVLPSAVPEFTGPIAAWAVVIICCLIYWRKRRKR